MAGNSRIWAGKPDTDQKPAVIPESWSHQRLNVVYLVIAGLVFLMSLILLWRLFVVLIIGTPGHLEHAPGPVVNSPIVCVHITVAGEPALGPENAPVTIVEFADFQCPFCKRFYTDVETALLQKYQGKIRFVFRDFPIYEMHPDAEIVAEAAQCAHDQGKFWDYHDVLFKNQTPLDRDHLLAFAKQVNLDSTVFQSCLDNHQTASRVQRDRADGIALGVTGTPTFFINGQKLVGVVPLSVFSTYIDADLSASSPNACGL